MGKKKEITKLSKVELEERIKDCKMEIAIYRKELRRKK